MLQYFYGMRRQLLTNLLNLPMFHECLTKMKLEGKKPSNMFELNVYCRH